jgi:transcriptional regulator with XRE-family HTH domain
MQQRRRRRTAPTTEELFGNALRQLRKERGFSQETLAFESGYHPTYIGQLERGSKNPSLRAMVSLASVLNVLPSELLRRFEGLLGKDRGARSSREA